MKTNLDIKQVNSMSDIHWGFLAQGLNVATGLLLLPMILRYLPPEEVGLWFVFMSLAGLAQLLELGFLPTITRNVAYLYAGAQKLNAYGYEPTTEHVHLNIELLQQLFMAAREIYLVVSLSTLAFLAVIGTTYISMLLTHSMPQFQIIFAWIAFALGYVINFYYGYFNGFLQGRGDVKASNQIIVANRVVLIVLASLLLAEGWGLLGVGFASLISSVIGRGLAARIFWSGGGAETFSLKVAKVIKNNSLISILWPNAKKLGWVYLGSFLITRANVLIASSFLGLAATASYGLTFQILTTFTSLSAVVFNLNMPHFSGDQIRGRHENILEKFGKSLATGWLVYLVCTVILFLFGNTLLALIGSRTHLLEANLLFLFVIIMFLEMNHSLCAGYLTTFNEIPFVRAALVSGICIVSISVLTVSVFHFEIWGLLLSQGVVQVFYNNWMWPMEAARKLNHSFAYVLASGFRGLWKDCHA